MELQPGDERLRRAFKKYLNPFMLAIWRLGCGVWFSVWPAFSGKVLVLVHKGRVTGLKRFQPLNYTKEGKDIYCIAAFGEHSDWFKNLKQNPEVEVWLPDGWWAGTAGDKSDSPDRTRLIRKVLSDSGVVAYLAGFNPHKMADEQLDLETRNYRLVRIQRTHARSGPGGPGDLSWVWQAATFGLLGWIIFRRMRK